MARDATQYLLPAGIGLDAALVRLASHFDLASEPGTATARTFYDTFDGRLHAAGLALIGEGGRLVAAAASGYREIAGATLEPGSLIRAGDLPDGRLRDLLEPIIEVRALQAIARTRGRRQVLRVRNADAKTVVRLVLEAAALAGNGRAEVPLRSRVHVVGVRGYDRATARVERVLADELGLEATPVGLHHEAVAAGGGVPGGVSTKLELRLAAEAPARAGAVMALAAMLRTIELTLPGVLADIDSEFLHDLRVAVRRTRSIQRQLAAAFPAGPLAGFRAGFRWLGQVTGPTRDLDVLLLDFARLRAELPAGRGAELEPMGDLLRRRRELERSAMAAALGSERARGLLADWAGFLAGIQPAGDGDDPGKRPLGEVVGRRIRTVYRQMRRAGLAIDDGAPAEHLHDLRKEGKELRYLLEIFAGLYPPAAVRPTVRTLKDLQETLGAFQDREVQAMTMRSLGPGLAEVDGGPAALIALGVVLERVEAESTAARAQFAERFAAYAGAAQRAVIREAFR